VSNNKLQAQIESLGIRAKAVASELAQLDANKKKATILLMAKHLSKQCDAILAANRMDVEAAGENGVSKVFLDRLLLSEERLMNVIQGLQAIAELPEPVGKLLHSWQVDTGLKISRVTVPIGVIAIIYESRPNVTVDAAGLCFKSGNAVILRGGSESAETNKALTNALQQGLLEAGVSVDAIQYLPTQDRMAIDILLNMDKYIDVIVPRGGKSLIQRIREKSRIPIFSHLEGICHTYVHQDAQLAMAVDIIVNAKMRRPGICGATETLLIDQVIAKRFLPQIIQALQDKGCEIRGDEGVQQIVAQVKSADEEDWRSEYLDAIIAIKIVADYQQAITHINHYGSHHTEAIITDNKKVAEDFLRLVDSAIVMHNCSTQFADGGEFGMGAEIGIATGKLHARGPVGIEQLTTFKYRVEGNGQTRNN